LILQLVADAHVVRAVPYDRFLAMTHPDVARVVEAIREDIEARRARGDYTPEDIEALFDQRLRAYVAEATIDPKLGDRLRHESHDWNIDTGYWIRSNRPGIAGIAIRFAKRIVRPFVRLYTDHILNRQAQINLVVWHFLLDSVRRTLLLELEVKKLRHDIDTLKRGR
jgi:hypothetical protein